MMLIAIFVCMLHGYLASKLCGSFGYDNVYFDLNSGESFDRVQNITFPNGKNATLYYNLCQSISEVCSIKTPLTNGSIHIVDHAGPATLVLQNQCIPFLEIKNDNLYDPSNTSSSYVINYSSLPMGKTNQTTNITYNLILIAPCHTSLHNQWTDNSITIISTLQGCPVLDLTTIWGYFDHHKFAFFLTTLIFGCIMMLLGIYMYRITIWLVGGLAGFGILLLIESVIVFLPGVPNDLINSIVIITGITSIFIGYVTLYFPKLGTFGLGAWVGVILSFILNNIALFRIKSSISALPLLITLAILGVVFGVLALFFKKSFVIISTSFIGAYCSIRALSWYLGAFPNEFLISKQRQYLGASVQWQYYVYVVALFILSASSMAVQFWLFRKRAKLLGKSTNIDQYINQINEQINLQRSKYLVFENVFKKKRRSSIEQPRYLKGKKKPAQSNSESNYSSQQNSKSQQQSQQQQQSQYQMKQIPKKLVKFQKTNLNKNQPQSKTIIQRRTNPQISSNSQRSEQNSRSGSQSQSEQQRDYKNVKKKQPESKKSLKQKLLPKQQGRRN